MRVPRYMSTNERVQGHVNGQLLGRWEKQSSQSRRPKCYNGKEDGWYVWWELGNIHTASLSNRFNCRLSCQILLFIHTIWVPDCQKDNPPWIKLHSCMGSSHWSQLLRDSSQVKWVSCFIFFCPTWWTSSHCLKFSSGKRPCPPQESEEVWLSL